MQRPDQSTGKSIQLPLAQNAYTIKRQLHADILNSLSNCLSSILRQDLLVQPLFDVHYFSDTLRVVEFLKSNASKSADADLGKITGPEIFRWLGSFGWAYRNGEAGTYNMWLLKLSQFLLARCLPLSSKLEEPLYFYLKVDEDEHPYLPQIEGPIFNDPIKYRWVKAVLKKDSLVLKTPEGEQVLDAGELVNRIDGFNPDREKYTIGDSNIYLHQSGTELRSMVAELNEAASAPIQSDENLQVIDWDVLFEDSYCRKIMDTLTAGTAYLEKHSEDLYGEVSALMDGITLLTGGRFVGSSDIWYNGIAVFNPDDTWTEITFADHLVHEGAHLLLHAFNELTPILLNPFEEGAPSPIRSDPRPLYGTFHATFVFMRLVQFFERVVESGEINEEVEFRYHRHLKGFYEGMEVIGQYARFSSAGARIFGEMKAYHDQLRQKVSKPEPEKFQNLSRDYVI